MKIIIGVLILNLFLVGCTTMPSQGFYWGSYSNTLYQYKKSPSPKTLAAHQNELEDIIKVCKENNRPTPPGIYAELGQIFLNRGDKIQAVNYFHQEAQAYPESLPLMQHLIKQTAEPAVTK